MAKIGSRAPPERRARPLVAAAGTPRLAGEIRVIPDPVRGSAWIAVQLRQAIVEGGYGHGETVREVVDVVKRVSGVDFPVTVAPRRAGDPAAVIAKSDKIREVLGWKPKRDDLETIVRQALDWERRLHNRGIG